MAKKEKKIRIEVEGKTSLPHSKLEPFQGDLKHLEKAEYEELRGSILKYGFSFVIHVWKNKGKNYIIDGHQRLSLVRQMEKVEGFTVPPLPVAFVSAASFAEAKRKVLAGTSQYGKMNPETLAKYAKENDIALDEILANFHFPEIDFTDLTKFFDIDVDDNAVGDVPKEKSEKDSPSGSDKVRQLQLFFGAEDYSEFVEKVEAMKEIHKTENITDTLLEIVRESHKFTFRKSS